MIEVLLFAGVLAVIPAAIARNKGRSFGKWWVYGFLLFIIALPHSLLARRNEAGITAEMSKTGHKKCPFCAEWVRSEAVVCKHCGRDLPGPAAQRTPAALPGIYGDLPPERPPFDQS